LDFLFPSACFKGSKPLSPDSILEKSIRPALARIGVLGRHIGWHSFRHSLATNLRSLGVDIKVAQELMRHSSCRTTLDIYTRAVEQQKREASLKVVELMLPLEIQKLQHPRKMGMRLVGVGKYMLINELFVDLIVIEPMTSSMPFTAKYRRHSTYEPASPAETAQWALFAGKMRAKLQPSGQRAGCVESAHHISAIYSAPTFGNCT
jgi:hypothetical protein